MMRSVVGRQAVVVFALLAVAETSEGQRQSARDAASAVNPFWMPATERIRLSNGLEVVVVENTELPIVAVRVAIRGAPFLDPEGKEGLYALTSTLLREGSTAFTADQMARQFAEMGSTVTPAGFLTTRTNFDSSLRLLAEMLIRPRFSEETFQRERLTAIAAAQRTVDQPRAIAEGIARRVALGSTSPRARTPTVTSLGSLTLEDVRSLHRDRFEPGSVKLLIVGDVRASQVRGHVNDLFGDWRARAGVRDQAMASAIVPPPRHIYLHDRPHSTQATIVIAQTGPARNHADFHALMAAGAVFGNAEGRLNDNLRERRAFTYGATAVWQWPRAGDVGVLLGTADVHTVKADSAIAQWVEELRGIAGQRPITEQELGRAVGALTHSLPGQLETVDDLAGALADALQNDLPLNYQERYAKAIRQLTADAVTGAARRHLDPARVVVVVVGSASELEPRLRALGIGEVILVDDSGSPVVKAARSDLR